MRISQATQLSLQSPTKTAAVCESFVAIPDLDGATHLYDNLLHKPCVGEDSTHQAQTQTFAITKPKVVLQGHSKAVNALAFHQCNNDGVILLCTASRDRVLLWDVPAILHGNLSGCRSLQESPSSDITFISFDASGAFVALCHGKEVFIYFCVDGRLFMKLEGHIGQITACLFNPHKPQEMITISEDRTFKIWDLEARRVVCQSPIIGASPMLCAAFDEVKGRLAVGFADGRVRFYSFDRSDESKAGLTNGGVAVAREIHCIDLHIQLSALEKKDRLMRAAEEAHAAAPAIISSMPVWAMSAEAKESKRAFDQIRSLDNLRMDYATIEQLSASTENMKEDLQAELAFPILQMGYYTSSTHPSKLLAEQHSTPISKGYPSNNENRFVVPKESPIKAFYDTNSLLFVGTPTSIVHINTRTYEWHLQEDLRTPSTAVADQPSLAALPPVKLASQYVFWAHLKLMKCIIVPSFEARVLLIAWAVNEMQTQASSVVETHGVSTQNAGASTSSKVLSVFPTSALPQKSPLWNWEFKPKVPEVTAGTKTKRNTTGTAGRGSGVKNMPVTFHKSVKSSGYGKEPPPKLFGKSNKPARSRPGSSRGSAAGSSNNNNNSDPLVDVQHRYPENCGTARHHQEKNFLKRGVIHNGPINDISYSSEAVFLATASNDCTVRTIRLPTARFQGEGTTYAGHKGKVTSVRWNHRSSALISTSGDGTARLWGQGRSDALLVFSHRVRDVPVEVSIEAATRQSSGSTAKPGPSSSAASLGAPATKSQDSDARRNSAYGSDVVDASFFYLDKFILLAAGSDMFLYKYLLDHEKKKDDLNRLQNNSRYKAAATWAQDFQSISSFDCVNSCLSHLIVMAGSNRCIRLFDASVGECVRTIEAAHTRNIHTIRLPSPSGYTSHAQAAFDMFATSSADGSIKLWDIRSPKCVNRFAGHVNRVHKLGISFSPCLRYLATGSEDKVAIIYDLRAGTTLERLQGHAETVSAVAYSPKFPQLATASYDQSIRFYVDTDF